MENELQLQESDVQRDYIPVTDATGTVALRCGASAVVRCIPRSVRNKVLAVASQLGGTGVGTSGMLTEIAVRYAVTGIGGDLVDGNKRTVPFARESDAYGLKGVMKAECFDCLSEADVKGIFDRAWLTLERPQSEQ